MVARHTVAAVVAQGLAAFELGVAAEVFGLDRSYLVDPWYRFLVCAAEPPPLTTSSGFSIHTPHRLDAVAEAGTVIVPAWRQVDEKPPEPMLEALRSAAARGARVVSVCTGAFVLAQAGLLDGRRATTHWAYAAVLAQRFPAIDVDPDVLYVVDENVMTSAGTSAGIDLCLHLVRQDHGAEVANAVARRMVVPPHRHGGQAQYVEAPVPTGRDDNPLAAALDWAVGCLDQPLTVDQLARRAAMAPRTFARHFHAATGTTPHQWLLRQRVLLAQRLLETTDEPVERVASSCGFGSAAALRQHFSRHLDTSPASYRRTFRAPASAPGR